MQEPAGALTASPASGVPTPKDSQPSNPAPAGSSAQKLAPQFGGLRSGRKRKDGLVPGSPEAREADLKADRDRKARKRNPDPAPLPSSSARNGRAAPPPGPAPVHIVTPQAGPVAGVPTDSPGSFVPWEAKVLEPIFAQLFPAAEGAMIRRAVERAQKGKLPAELLREIQSDGRWNPVAKKGLETSTPQVTADALNYFGVSAANVSVVVFATAVSSILLSHQMLIRRIDKAAAAIAAAPPPVPQPGDKKP